MSVIPQEIRPEEDNFSSGGECLPIGLDEPVADIVNATIERIGDRPIEVNFNGEWEQPSGQTLHPGGSPTVLERRKFDARTGAYIGLGAITVGAALTAYFTYRHKQKAKG